MIWLFLGLVAWGVLMFVGAHKGSEKYYDRETKTEQQSAWMIPINLTAIAFVFAGVALSIFETGRIYGGW